MRTDPSIHHSNADQDAYLDLLARGASPSDACRQLGLSLSAIADALRDDPAFRARLDRVGELLSQNVAAALYRAAMEGNVSAQTFYLRNQPPPEWPQPEGAMNELDELTDDELLDRCRTAGVDLPPEIAAVLRLARGAPLAAPVPPEPAS